MNVMDDIDMKLCLMCEDNSSDYTIGAGDRGRVVRM